MNRQDRTPSASQGIVQRSVRAWNRVVHNESGAQPSSIVATALLFGMGTGTVEGLHVFVVKALHLLDPATQYQSVEALWMAPIGESFVLVLVGLLIAVVTRAWRRPVAWRFFVTVLSGVAVYGILRSMRLGIWTWPGLLLALGLAVRIGEAIAHRVEVFRRRLRMFIGAGVVWVATAALLLHGGRAVAEWWGTNRLPTAGDDPNVILLILDTVRASNMSVYGHEHRTTPRLEQIAREGMLLDGAIAPAPWTLPAHASMITGVYPWTLGVGWTASLHGRHPTLAEELARRGYATAGFSANYFYAGRAAGIARGFRHFEDAPVNIAMLICSAWLLDRAASHIRWLNGCSVGNTRDARTISDGFLAWTRNRGDRPFFALVNYMDAHSPYRSPDSILSRFSDHRPLRSLEYGRVYSQPELEDLHAAYDAAIAFIDGEIGRIVDTLRSRGELDRTVLIVTADHGEQLGEHQPGLHGHGNSLYGSSLEVPLLIRYPALVPAGLRRRQTVSTRRLPVTVMDMVGATDATQFAGASIATAFRAAPGAPGGERPALSFLYPGITYPNEPAAAGPMGSAVLGRWHYIRNGNGLEELYDFASDPWELHNLIGEALDLPLLDSLRAAVSVLVPFGVPAHPTSDARRVSLGR